MAKSDKQSKITVDEKRLQSIIAGDFTETSASTPPAGPVPEDKTTPPNKNTDKKPRRKKSVEQPDQQINYSEVFLQKIPVENRRQTTMGLDDELVKKINMLLSTQDNGITISSFVNNILLLHVEKYKEAINEIYENSRNKLF